MLQEWFVYYTYPKAERAIKRELERGDYEVFLPLQKINKQWSDRIKQLEVPLFPNYIFIRSKKSEIYSIIKHPKIVKYISFEGRPGILKDEEVLIIKKLANCSSKIEIDTSITTGDKVRIKSGPLEGLYGTLIEKKNGMRFGIKLNELNHTISVEIELKNVERIISME